jgi:hypothetical protein
MSEWQPMKTAPHDRTIWVYSATDCSDWVKPRLATWQTPVGYPGEFCEEGSDCTLHEPKCWCEAIIPKSPTAADIKEPAAPGEKAENSK